MTPAISQTHQPHSAKTRRCAIIIPVYNEENAIAKTYDRVRQTTDKINDFDFDLVFVNDGSTDSTKQILAGLDGATIIDHDHNRGYGAALRTGLEFTDHEWVIILDADGTYPIEDLKDITSGAAQGFDMVIGARQGEGIRVNPMKRIARWILRKVVHVLTGVMVPDLNSGMRIFRRNLYQEFKHLLPMGFSFTTTITVASLYSGYRIQFVPIKYFTRIGKSSIKPVQDFLGFMMLIIRLASYFEPLRFFVPLAVFVFTVGFLKGFQDFIYLNRIGNLSVIMMLSSLQVLITGILCDVLVRRSTHSIGKNSNISNVTHGKSSYNPQTVEQEKPQ